MVMGLKGKYDGKFWYEFLKTFFIIYFSMINPISKSLQILLKLPKSQDIFTKNLLFLVFHPKKKFGKCKPFLLFWLRIFCAKNLSAKNVESFCKCEPVKSPHWSHYVGFKRIFLNENYNPGSSRMFCSTFSRSSFTIYASF